MVLEIKKITQKEFDSYWTPEVCNIMNKYIRNTKLWATNFDDPIIGNKNWTMDVEKNITFIEVNVLSGVAHPSEFYGRDVAVVAKNGAIGLLQYQNNESSDDVYKIVILNGIFSNSVKDFESIVLNALRKGGGRLDGGKGICNKLSDNVFFIDSREDIWV